VYSMVQRREKEKYSRYIEEASAPAAAPCIRPVTSCTSVTDEPFPRLALVLEVRKIYK
jgi:hypothetical protein